MNEAYLSAIGHTLGVDVKTDHRATLLEAIEQGRARARPDLVAWLWARLGDLAFGSRGITAALHAYDEGQAAAPDALGPWIGLAQVAVANKRWSDWDRAVDKLAERLDEEADPQLVLRASGLLDVQAVRGGRLDADSSWRGIAGELEAADAPWAAWHIWMAGAAALSHRSAPAAFEMACGRALEVAVQHGLGRAAIWACLELVQHERATERFAEADVRIAGAIELAEQVGDPDLLGLVLRLGTDLAAQLGQSAQLVERLRLRANVAAAKEQPAEHVGLLHQAFLAASRARHDDSGSIGEELAEALIGGGLGAVPGLDVTQLLHTLVTVEAPDHARQVALAASQLAFRSGRRAEAAERLVDAARISVLLEDREDARAMFDEAIQVSQTFGLSLHQRWLDERRDLFGH